ncbi:hypothetical protein HD806DRAFT_542351 [Xylariaceae sp. AK1471]|nr:hypothetical protein HD806DRAFT_542351 [Xylariaceae sp. AK1471]
MASFYEQRMLRLFERYELSDNARSLLKAYDDVKTGKLDEVGLGRLIRMSPNNRAALVNTMVKCATIMKDTPRESKYCLIIIKSCGEMLGVADQIPPDVGFPGFTKLPREIRQRIYDIYLGNYQRAPAIIPIRKRERCICAPHEPPIHESFEPVPMALALTCKGISEEVLVCLYRNRKFHFPCACEMGWHLKNNIMLKSTISRIMFHWSGEYADVSIGHLQKTRQLEHLTVVVSRLTSKRLTKREGEIRRFFNIKRPTHAILPESLGWDELIAIRGLKSVNVLHINKRKADRRTDDERSSLQAMLQSYLLGEKEDDDD